MSLLENLMANGNNKVGDYFSITRKPRGMTIPSNREIPFIPMDAIPQNGSYEPRLTMKSGIDITSGTYFERGDILIGKITPSFENGKQALIIDLPNDFGYATTEVIPLRPISEDIDRRLLFFYLLHPEIREFVSEKMEGATGRQRVPEAVLLDLPYPAFDHLDQKIIADCLGMIQEAKQLEERGEMASQQLKSSAMHTLFSRGLRGEPQRNTDIGPVPESWEVKQIAELCDIWSGGTPRKSVPEYWRGEIPWVSGKDLKRPKLSDVQDHITAEAVNDGSRLAPAGAVLLLVRGMGLAKDLPVSVISRPMAFNQDVKALVTRGSVSGDFLRSAIYVRKTELMSRAVTSAHGTKTLNLNDVEVFEIACPTNPEEHDEIVAILDSIDQKIDLHKRKRAVLEELFKSLLHKLMTGEVLVSDLNLSALGIESDPTQEGTS